MFFFFQAEDGIRDRSPFRGLGDVYKRQILAGRSITSIVQSAKMQFRKLPDDQRETAINQFVHTLASAQGEVSACL